MTAQLSVFVHEMLDPSGESLGWLRERGVRVTEGYGAWEFPTRTMSTEEFVARAQGHTALMGAGPHRITAGVLDKLPELRFISKYGVGVDTIDLDAARQRNIAVANSPVPEIFEPVCEHTIALMLAVMRRLNMYTPYWLSGGGWRRPDGFGRSLSGCVVGLVGFGRIGRGVARRLRGWDVEVLVADPYIEAAEPYELVLLDELLERANVVSLHVAATPESHHLLDSAALGRMRPGAILINTSRGSLVDTEALTEALRAGHLGGAGLDVFETEPPGDLPLFGLDTVVATPHTASWTVEAVAAVAQAAAENLWTMMEGGVPETLVT